MAADFVAPTADTFAPHVGASFRVEGGRHVLALSQVERLENQPGHGNPAFEPFVLIFSGPPGDVLAEGMHTLAREDGEGGIAHDLYLIPVHTPAPGRQDYQAVFN
ncbi:hypothetical protein [Caulobacter sp. UNC279MFTsu5.1]|uniref:DUF6916 family protein n=1 Tax=Caulobacter sp. UNC279MFTsu5.1 TaxID=1502775 RepID=UPI0008E71A7B|nr:hypothetical protein [Caulobacter sp. UNC279MFTsu5.1]SFK54813.1 hypothetical protein SAMN02799626_04580 [Caulobacter sp. UNC279MFTsu5.1]